MNTKTGGLYGRIVTMCVAVVLVFWTGIARGDWLTPVGIGHMPSEYLNRESYKAIVDTGIIDFAAGTHSQVGVEMYLSGAGATNGALRLDLGEVYALTGLRILNYNESGQTSRGAKDIQVWVSKLGDLSEVTQVQTATVNGTPDSDGTFTLVQGPDNTTGNGGTTLTFSGIATRFIWIVVLNNYGSGTLMGISKVRFQGTATGDGTTCKPTTVSGKSSEQNPTSHAATTTINDVGLGSYGRHSGGGLNEWLANSTPAWIEYDLGANKNLSAIRIWNYTERLDRYAKSVTVEGKPDGGSYAILATIELKRSDDKALFLGSGTGGDNSDNDFSQLFRLAGAYGIRYVKLTINSNYDGGSSYVGLAEVQFLSSSVGPVGGTIIMIR